MNPWDAFYGPNAGYALELYERYLQDPSSVDVQTRTFFEQTEAHGDMPGAVATLTRQKSPANGNGHGAGNGHSGTVADTAVLARRSTPDQVAHIVAAARLARSIREYGHLAAAIDPLGSPRPGDPMIRPETHGITDADLAALPASIVFPSAGPEWGTCLDAVNQLRRIYCGAIGYEFDHVQDYAERTWLHQTAESGELQQSLPPEERRSLLRQLTDVETFERFLHTVYQGQKRFSLEGNDVIVPMLDLLVREAETAHVQEILIGMAHRGRLNVLAHILRKPYEAILAGFRGAIKHELHAPPDNDTVARSGGGDVKYHLGYHRRVDAASLPIEITLSDNPSHLEYVNSVIQGFARAAQDHRTEAGAPPQDAERALAVQIHGDAAFPGEGVVAETLNLSRLTGYNAGGSLHLIVNNQVGFTTSPEDGRSTLYASDLAKGFEIPIVHVNADDPEACLAMIRLAVAYRQRFHRDFLIDIVGYRRWGHNEGDEPSFTQPELYRQITSHPTARQIYAEQLVREDVMSEVEADALIEEARTRLREARDRVDGVAKARPGGRSGEHRSPNPDTHVSSERLHALNDALLQRPEGFVGNPKLERLLQRRRELLDREGGIDWAFAEVLAFASLLEDGTPIRLSGQDTERGTFSHRHLVLHDPESGDTINPLQRLPQARASFAVYNSPLTETAVLGFEYGYSVHAPETLVIWEAQYGDFANAGQVIVDQFITAARAKWGQFPALGLLLPHGYEGQGPEHSSGRLERYLQLAADGNMRVLNLTRASQYFHLLRLQGASLGDDRRPFVIMTPKSLLRHRMAASSLTDLSDGRFQPVLDDPTGAERRERITRVVLCSGKVAIDLFTSLEEDPVDWVAVGRVEQLYPFPAQELSELLTQYPNVREVLWVQEEPSNMGAWTFVGPRLRDLLEDGITLRYVGRPDRASVAEGSPDVHEWEQHRIIREAFDGQRTPKLETQRAADVD